MPTSASVRVDLRIGRRRLSERSVFHMFAVDTPLMVPPVKGSIDQGIRSSFWLDRADGSRPVTRLLKKLGNFYRSPPSRL